MNTASPPKRCRGVPRVIGPVLWCLVGAESRPGHAVESRQYLIIPPETDPKVKTNTVTPGCPEDRGGENLLRVGLESKSDPKKKKRTRQESNSRVLDCRLYKRLTDSLLTCSDGDCLQPMECSPHPVIRCFLCRRVETIEPGCSIDHTSILLGQHLYRNPART